MAQQKLTLKEKFAYGLDDMASNIVYQAVINVLMYGYDSCDRIAYLLDSNISFWL